MGSKLYVGGLPYAATETQLTTLFAAHGTVASARVIADKFTGQSRGFGFVEMSTQEEAQAAIAALNGTQMDGRSLTVNEAKPQEPRSGGGGRFSGGGASPGAPNPSHSRLLRGSPRRGEPFFCCVTDSRRPLRPISERSNRQQSNTVLTIRIWYHAGINRSRAHP
jgi:RNA recognition motif-containing protein